MSDAKTVTYHGGVSFLGLLAVVFVTLKLAGITEVAEWSWWWVLAPLWAPWAVFFGFIAFLFLSALVLAWVSSW